jgi:hypothetical protein
MKKLYVYSTLASDVLYQNHAPGGADLPIVVSEVLVKGGAGVANDRLITPRGVATEVTEQQAEALRANPVFVMHEKNGFVQISDSRVDADIAAADMTGRDSSAPIVPEDLPPDSKPMGSEESEAPAAPAKSAGKRGGK